MGFWGAGLHAIQAEISTAGVRFGFWLVPMLIGVVGRPRLLRFGGTRCGLDLVAMVLAASLAYADAYQTLMHRYERKSAARTSTPFLAKESSGKRARSKTLAGESGTAKAQWTQTGLAVDQARRKVATTKTAARKRIRWPKPPNGPLSRTPPSVKRPTRGRFLTTEVYKRQRTPRYFVNLDPCQGASLAVMGRLATLSQSTLFLRKKTRNGRPPSGWKNFVGQNEAQKQALTLDRFRHQQQSVWLHWQERYSGGNIGRRTNSAEQSARRCADVAELREHRDQTLAIRPDAPRATAALNALRGSLPGQSSAPSRKLRQHFSEKLQQLIVSNGIGGSGGGEAGAHGAVGQVLFARPSRSHGQLSSSSTPMPHLIYGELGETQVKEGDLLRRWTPSG